MGSYLLVETRTSWESSEVVGFFDMAEALADQGNQVDLVLMQNAVVMAKVGQQSRLLELAERSNVTLWADDFSLAERAISESELEGVVALTTMQAFVTMLTRPENKPIWHG